VFHRGINRQNIFPHEKDRLHFLDLLAELHVRYRFTIHCYVLMDTHYHMFVQTPEANLSAGMHWLHTSYAAWFNTRYQRGGPLWRGRFGSVPVEDGIWSFDVSLYIHLNPVCTVEYSLSKIDQALEGLALKEASPEMVTRRLKQLRTYPWSSYRSYAGYVKAPGWLHTATLLSYAPESGKSLHADYRLEAQQLLRKGAQEDRSERMRDAFALGSEGFLEKVRDLSPGNVREIAERSQLQQYIAVDAAFEVVEKLSGMRREEYLATHGHWGAGMVMWLLHNYGGMTYRQIGAVMGGKDYSAVCMRLKRMEKQVTDNKKLELLVKQAVEMLYVKT
jgi:REP element-mobilizing transposase RayT